jgi:tetratricopeptide (TPR) repeat protein
MPQIGIEHEHHHHECWHHWHHWHPPTTDFGSGNTFSATNTYSPTIENSGNTKTEVTKSTPKTDDAATTSAPKQVSKEGMGDPTAQANGADKNDKKDVARGEGQDLFDNALASFKQGNYDKALEQVGAAIENQPNVASLHEFKALCYFAQRRYKEAAPVLYAVVSSGPGWDMDTIKSFYPNQDTYVKQLDALKSFVEQQPDLGYGHFVLAYHYLTRGSTMLAKKQLQEAVRIQPDDKLSTALLKVL